MSALFESGAFREVPWHKYGTVLGDGMPSQWDEIKEPAGVGWKVQVDPVSVKEGEDKYNYIRRSDTGRQLAIKRESYTPLQNDDFGAVAQMCVDDFGAEYEAVTSLRGGALITATLTLGEPWTVPGARSRTFGLLNLVNAHDGTRAFRVAPSAITIVCANTESLAEAESRRHGVVFAQRHSGAVKDSELMKAEVRAFVEGAHDALRGRKILAGKIATSPIISQKKFLEAWLPMPDDPSNIVHNNVWMKRVSVMNIIHKGVTIGDADSPWSLYQAAIEADQHIFKHDEEVRVAMSLVGGSHMSRRALSIVKEMTGVS